MGHSIAVDYRLVSLLADDRRAHTPTRARAEVSSAPALILASLMAVLAASDSQIEQLSAEYISQPGEPVAAAFAPSPMAEKF